MTDTSKGHHLPVDPADLIEFGEFCGFLHDWISAERDTLAPSMHRFTFGLFSLDEIRRDLSRFAWALGIHVAIPDDTNDHDDEDDDR